MFLSYPPYHSFGFRFGCDADGWMLKVNDEDPYPHFVHLFEPMKIKSVEFFGDAVISYIGFGPSGNMFKMNFTLKPRWLFQI